MEQENKEIDDFTEEDKIEKVPFWDYKEKTTIIGTFIGWESITWEEDKTTEHGRVKTSDGEMYLPSLTFLNSELKKQEIENGARFKIIYKGDKKSKNSRQEYATFDIYIK